MVDLSTRFEKSLLVIDQVPLFTEALDACQRACRSIDLLKAELHRHEARDLPAFDRWYNAAFGRYLTETRELSALLYEKQHRLASVRKTHWARFFGPGTPIAAEMGMGPEGASASTSSMHATWTASDSEENEGFSVRDAEEDSLGHDHEDYRWEESEYHDEDEWGADQDSARFEELLRSGRRSSAYRSRGPAHEDDRARFDGFRRSGGTGAGPGRGRGEARTREEVALDERELRVRLKERYRILVRKLHPDLGADLTADRKSLWIQVQAAYAKGDLEQLDLLVVLSDAFEGSVSQATSLGQLKRAVREIERLTGPLRTRLDQAREHRAWNFSELDDRSQLHRTVEKEFQRDLLRLREQLAQLDAQIARFTRTARSPMAESRV